MAKLNFHCFLNLVLLAVIFNLTAISVQVEAAEEAPDKITLDDNQIHSEAKSSKYWPFKRQSKQDALFHWIPITELVQLTPSILLEPSIGHSNFYSRVNQLLINDMTSETAQELLNYISNKKLAEAHKQYVGGLDRLESFFKKRFNLNEFGASPQSLAAIQFQQNFHNSIKILRSFDELHGTDYSLKAGFSYIDSYGDRFAQLSHEQYFRNISYMEISGQIYLAAVKSHHPDALSFLLSKIADLDLKDQRHFLMIYGFRKYLIPGEHNERGLKDISFMSAISEILLTEKYERPPAQIMYKLFVSTLELLDHQIEQQKNPQNTQTKNELSMSLKFIEEQKSQLIKSAISYFQTIREPLLMKRMSRLMKEHLPIVKNENTMEKMYLERALTRALNELLELKREKSPIQSKDYDKSGISSKAELVTRQINGAPKTYISIQFSGEVERSIPYLESLRTAVMNSEYPVLIEGIDQNQLKHLFQESDQFDSIRFGIGNKKILFQNKKMSVAPQSCSALF